VGEVVSTSRIDESLPEGSMLLVYELERTGDIEYRSLSGDIRQQIEGRSDTFRSRFSADILNEDSTESAEAETDNVQREISAGETQTISDLNQPDSSLDVSEVSITASENIQNVGVSVSDDSTISESVEDPPGNQINLLNISASASNSEVQEATIRFEVSKSNVPADSQLQVYRYNDGQWEELETRKIDENNEVVVLEAETPGFSPFAVSYGSDSSVDSASGGSSIAPIVGLVSVTTSLGGLVISGIGVLLIIGAAIGKVIDSRLTNISFKTAILVFVGGILLFIISVIVTGVSFVF
jgi:PGF-pre-PGF domain-containing protein